MSKASCNDFCVIDDKYDAKINTCFLKGYRTKMDRFCLLDT
jgi:hypothetical protein